jgi:hypothetical protein
VPAQPDRVYVPLLKPAVSIGARTRVVHSDPGLPIQALGRGSLSGPPESRARAVCNIREIPTN